MAASQMPYLPPAIRLSPVHSRTNSRSTSPERNPGALYQKLDPLLSNLSPESTLHALTSTEAVPSNEKRAHDILSQSISQVSPAERALGIRAAVAARNLSLWLSEVQSWGWPTPNEAKAGKSFVPPPSAEPRLGPGRTESSSLSLVSSTEHEYYGSLPAAVVERYETRIEEIRDGMDDLNVEELKEHVLSAHIPARSRPSSNNSSVSIPAPLSYVQLSDFTAVITTIILRALPFLSKLNSLLSTWDVRLLVLRQIPGLLRELHLTRTALDSSLNELRTSDLSDTTHAPFSSSYLQSQHVQLESAVVTVGRRMDRVLDALEGRQDSLPERWIDDLEGIESDFAAWVVEAERYKIRAEWLQNQPPVDETLASSEPEPEEQENSVHEMEPIEEEPAEEDSIENASIEKDSFGEEPQRDSETSSEDSAQQPVEQSVAQTEQESMVSYSDGPDISTFENQSPSGSPPAAEVPGIIADREDTPEKHPSIAVAENLRTPTQIEFLTELSGEQQTPTPSTTQRPIPVHENKENVPPLNFKQHEPATPPLDQSSPVKSVALTEHRGLAEDPFIKSQASGCEVGHEEVPFVDKPDDSQTDLGSSNEAKDAIEIDAHQETTTEKKAPQTPLSSNRSLPKEAEPVMTPKSPEHSAIRDSQLQQLSDTPKVPGTPTLAEIHGPVPSPSKIPILQTVPTKSDNSATRSQSVKPRPSTEQIPEARPNSRLPLQSPIKLSKARRPGKLDLDKNTPKPHRRRTSSGSVDSLLSDTSSLISSVDPPEPRTGSSNETPLLRKSKHPKHEDSGAMPPYSGHTLREDRLRRLESPKGSSLRAAFQQSRTVSLPMERFINERMDIRMGDVPDTALPDGNSSTPTSQVPRAAPRRPTLTRGKSASELATQLQRSRFTDPSRDLFSTNLFPRALNTQSHHKSHLPLRKRLTAHPSLESLGIKRQELAFVEEDEAELPSVEIRASTPVRQLRKPRDQLDRKVSSILNTLPGRIHLVDPNNEPDTSSSSSSLDRRLRGRFGSESPTGLASRSITPAPSLTLMPAGRRRQSAHKSEDSYVKLYHLHHGGQTAPTKLFVRTVGEEGQRVMVRVGGGWADLGEYLREYIIHHGRRKVSETTPRVEVQGLASRESPAYSPSPSTLLSSTAPTSSYLTSGRATPSRPPSVLSARPLLPLQSAKQDAGPMHLMSWPLGLSPQEI